MGGNDIPQVTESQVEQNLDKRCVFCSGAGKFWGTNGKLYECYCVTAKKK